MHTDGRSMAIAMRPGVYAPRRTGQRIATRSAAAITVVAAVLWTGVLGPLSLLGLGSIVAMCVLLTAFGRAHLSDVLATLSQSRKREQRRYARQCLLPAASCGNETLGELTHLVEQAEREDPVLVDSFDLEGLLDRHVALTLAHERAVRAMAMSDRVQLERIRDGCRADPSCDKRRLDLCERRIRCLDQCEARAERLADELAIVNDLIRLIAQRAACPEEPQVDDSIDQRLAELDADEAARRQLASELA